MAFSEGECVKIEVVIPTLNEEKGGFFGRLLLSLQEVVKCRPQVQVRIVDGGSEDRTCFFARKVGFHVTRTAARSRARRLNVGLATSKADLVILHHPRVCLSLAAFDRVLQEGEMLNWGCFSHRFLETRHPALRFVSWYSNTIRVDRCGIVYLDHCFAINLRRIPRAELQIPEVDIFEDTELSILLARYGLPTRFSEESLCSPVRFQRNGIWKQLALNQVMKVLYRAGCSHEFMNRFYERSLEFNTTYEKVSG